MLKAIAEYAKHDRAEFVRVVQEAQSSQQTAEVKKQRTRLATAKQRVSELEVLLCKIYEDNILGKLSDSRYATLDAQYEKEQSELTAEISALEKAIRSYEKHEKDADRFIALIDKYENFDKLTIAITCDPQTVINDKKVTDHHAVIPTRNLKDADLSALPAGEKAVLELVALRLLCAVAHPHIYSETVAIAACAGGEFTAKGKTVRHPGWKALEDAYRAKTKDAEPKKEGAEKALPELTEGQTLSVSAAIVKEGKSSPPQHFTEDTLLSAMETAGKEDMPEDAERKGLGTPATRAGILEKLVSAGFLERKKNRKTVQLLPSHDAVSLITVLPEQLQSPLLTAEWEYRLGEIERGQLAPEEFLDGISAMLKDLVGTYQVIKGTEYLFAPPREVVGKCPRCGGEVAELQKGFFCQNDSCKFAIWKNNKWWDAKKKQPTKAVVSALLNDGRVHVTGLYSEKTGKTYDAAVVLEDDGQYANFKLEFDQRKGGSR